KAVFPGMQGGPLMHVIAAKAVAFYEALTDEFVEYQKQVVKNAKVLADEMSKRGYRVISGGTDNHLMLIDVKGRYGITGKDAESILHGINITCNKNGVPFDKEKPAYASGIRLGTPAATTRGFKEAEMLIVAELVDEALANYKDESKMNEIKNRVIELTRKFPLYTKGV
ncbi:MAG: serine hydroxymethyltransferase, partial [Tenericutes bacterium HGW-Tenericutes-3]